MLPAKPPLPTHLLRTSGLILVHLHPQPVRPAPAVPLRRLRLPQGRTVAVAAATAATAATTSIDYLDPRRAPQASAQAFPSALLAFTVWHYASDPDSESGNVSQAVSEIRALPHLATPPRPSCNYTSHHLRNTTVVRLSVRSGVPHSFPNPGERTRFAHLQPALDACNRTSRYRIQIPPTAAGVLALLGGRHPHGPNSWPVVQRGESKRMLEGSTSRVLHYVTTDHLPSTALPPTTQPLPSTTHATKTSNLFAFCTCRVPWKEIEIREALQVS